MVGKHAPGAAGGHRRTWNPALRRFTGARIRVGLAVLLAPSLIVGVALAAVDHRGLEQVAEASEDPDRGSAADLLALPTPSTTPTPTAKPSTATSEKSEKSEKSAKVAAKPKAKAKRTGPTGRYVVAKGRQGAPKGKGQVVRYLVEVEEGLRTTPESFAADVHRILNEERGWGRGGATMRFVRVDSGSVRFRVSLSSPNLTDRQCHPLRTFGRVSCFNGRRAVINNARWRHGSPTYGDDVAGYREYLVNHEVGHALGRRHKNCTTRGAPAPVMVQQTKSLEGCAANPWPYQAPASKKD